MYRFFILNVFFSILLATNVSANFRTEVIDTSNAVFEMTDHSSAVDSSGAMHVAYGRDALFYATNKSGQWIVEQVDNRGGYTSLALDSQGNVHISYRGNDQLKYASNISGVWQIEVVDSSISRVGHSSIAIDSLGNVHIAYSKEPCLMWCTAGHQERLYYANKLNDTWQTTVLNSDGGTGIYPSLIIDRNNKLHISYFQFFGVNDRLNYLTNSSGVWIDTIIHVGSLGLYSSIEIDTLNNVYISSYDYLLNTLNISTNESGSWQTETIDNTGNVGEYTSIALDSNNKVHISYRDVTNSALKYIHNKDGNWSATTLDNNGSINNGTSIALDRNGNVHIIYYDESNQTVKYISNAPVFVAIPLFGLPGMLLLIGLMGFSALRWIQKN